MKLEVVSSSQGKKVGELAVTEEFLSKKKHTQAVHDAAVAYLAARRNGNASTKGRSEVAKSGQKPWRQKGTGNARAGSAASPIWRGGGVVFGPKPRDYRQSLPKKVKRLALAAAVAQKIVDGELLLVDELKVGEAKTKTAAALLKTINVNESALLVLEQPNKDFGLAVRNLPKIDVVDLAGLNTLDVLSHKKLVMSQKAFEEFSNKVEKK